MSVDEMFTVAGVCSCDNRDTKRNSYGESKLEFSWSQEQTVRLRSLQRSCNGQGPIEPWDRLASEYLSTINEDQPIPGY